MGLGGGGGGGSGGRGKEAGPTGAQYGDFLPIVVWLFGKDSTAETKA